ncbi:PiggyBac transposable element-derived protein 4 [Plakobranchus ocellatus]|uniref:PiggyBac transposable element-derived protein 4 n=1 Tax=Plakobranchus ocellatus TaxID=259542 RepID=A0AAV4BHB0_9GAST|nr:PiggyBac transposable element-derived protein 4 [Plakobranchus ocellatus]
MFSPSQTTDDDSTFMSAALNYFFNMLDLASVAALVVFRCKFPMDVLSQPDNRQRFNIHVSRTLAINQIQQRAAVPRLQESVKLNITTVLKALLPAAKPIPQPPLAKVAQQAVKQKRCTYCPAKKDRKTKTVCNNCQRHICQEHSLCVS